MKRGKKPAIVVEDRSDRTLLKRLADAALFLANIDQERLERLVTLAEAYANVSRNADMTEAEFLDGLSRVGGRKESAS